MSGGLHDRGHTQSTGGTDGDQPSGAGAFLGEHLGEIGDDPSAGGAEWVSRAERAAVDVELGSVDGTERLVETEPLLAEDGVLPRAERAQDLRRERLVDLVEVEV